MKRLSVLIFLSLLVSLNASGQYAVENSDTYSVFDSIGDGHFTLGKAGLVAVAATPLVFIAVNNQVKNSPVGVETTWDIRDKDDYSHLVATIPRTDHDDVSEIESRYPNCTAYTGIRNIYAPKWIPWAAGGATLALGIVLIAVDARIHYNLRVNKYRQELALEVSPNGVSLYF